MASIIQKKGLFVIFTTILLIVVSCKQKEIVEDTYLELVPKPQNLVWEDDFFEINSYTKIICPQVLITQGEYLKSFIEENSRFDLTFDQEGLTARKNVIILELNEDQFEDSIGFDKYHLEIFPKYIHLIGESEDAIFRGLQTIRQLLPNRFHDSKEQDHSWNVKCAIIDDYSDFKHRGLLLDCCRHFFDKKVVKKYIDLLAFYKMNVLHWHLTEDQGWRIEIDSYPLLNTISASRTELEGSIYSGIYSKEDIREIVAYAEERGITIIPEIELPGHAQAALSAYPQFSCIGENIEVANDWGVFKEIYCAGNDSTFIFLESILDEVMELFPSEYIHIGGDEAPKSRWEECSKCQKRINDEGLHDEHELQSYFIQRIENYLNAKGRKLIGWDEILEGGLSQNATVQSWRGVQGGIQASEENHQVIMSPTSHCYFDYDLKSIDLEKVYHFNPIPNELDEEFHSFIIGGECNMWTEHVPDENTLDSKVFPRLLAMAEVLWNNPGSDADSSYSEFSDRVFSHNEFLFNKHVSYGLETSPLSWDFIPDTGNKFKSITASTKVKNADLSYRWICDTCPGTFMTDTKSIFLDKDGKIEFRIQRDNYSGALEYLDVSYHLALGKTVEYAHIYSDYYKGGGNSGLVNALKGSIDFRDGNWQGFWGDDFSATIDFEEVKTIQSVECSFYQYINAWIFIPQKCIVESSTDGENWNIIESWSPDLKIDERGKHISNMNLNFDEISAQYIRISAKNLPEVPEWHEASGSKAWIFIDEISIK